MIKNGKTINCSHCGTETYKPLGELKRSKNHFCSSVCAMAFQKRNQIQFSCKICDSKFTKPKSEVEKSLKRGHQIQYCSILCRNADSQRMTEKAQKMNFIQLHKSGLNNLEISGREWLQSLGFILNVDFFEQVLLFEKFCVDIYFPKFNFVVQFDGEYWHNQLKRKQLDISQDSYLEKAGIRVFRITDKQMKSKDESLFQTKFSEFLFAFNPNFSNSKIIFYK